MTTTAYLSFRRSCATEKSQKTIDRDPSALRFVEMTNNAGNKAKTCVFIKLLYRRPVGAGAAMTTTAYLSFRRSCATEKSQKTIDRDSSALRFVEMTNNTGNKVNLMYLCQK